MSVGESFGLFIVLVVSLATLNYYVYEPISKRQDALGVSVEGFGVERSKDMEKFEEHLLASIAEAKLSIEKGIEPIIKRQDELAVSMKEQQQETKRDMVKLEDYLKASAAEGRLSLEKQQLEAKRDMVQLRAEAKVSTEKLEGKVEQVEGKVEKLEGKVEKLEGKVDVVLQELRLYTSQSGELRSLITALKETLPLPIHSL